METRPPTGRTPVGKRCSAPGRCTAPGRGLGRRRSPIRERCSAPGRGLARRPSPIGQETVAHRVVGGYGNPPYSDTGGARSETFAHRARDHRPSGGGRVWKPALQRHERGSVEDVRLSGSGRVWKPALQRRREGAAPTLGRRPLTGGRTCAILWARWQPTTTAATWLGAGSHAGEPALRRTSALALSLKPASDAPPDPGQGSRDGSCVPPFAVASLPNLASQ